MLVLSRKEAESIVIADNITITVVAIGGDKVRLGITAPKNIPIHRQEVHDLIVTARTAAGLPRVPHAWQNQLEASARPTEPPASTNPQPQATGASR